MKNVKALRYSQLTYLYEPSYKGHSALFLFIEKINLQICSIEAQSNLEKNKKVEWIWEERDTNIPQELYTFESEIVKTFQDAGWYARVTLHPRWASLILKTVPFNEDDTGSSGL